MIKCNWKHWPSSYERGEDDPKHGTESTIKGLLLFCHHAISDQTLLDATTEDFPPSQADTPTMGLVYQIRHSWILFPCD